MYIFWSLTFLTIGFFLQASEEIQINCYYSFFNFVIAQNVKTNKWELLGTILRSNNYCISDLRVLYPGII